MDHTYENMDMVTGKKNKKSGDNIVNKIENPQEFANNFISFYYNKIVTGEDFSMFRDFSVFKYQQQEYRDSSLIALLHQINQQKNNIINIEVMPSGSRRFDILIMGKMNETIFSQYFMLTHEKADVWYIKSSIISLIN
tara:strand:- start:1810 stop:2223 length:414 start_codon:yes stop_codon:yes gene_type:complete